MDITKPQRFINDIEKSQIQKSQFASNSIDTISEFNMQSLRQPVPTQRRNKPTGFTTFQNSTIKNTPDLDDNADTELAKPTNVKLNLPLHTLLPSIDGDQQKPVKTGGKPSTTNAVSAREFMDPLD